MNHVLLRVSRRAFFCAALAAAMGLLGGPFAAEAPAQGKKPLRFGVADPLTGPAAIFGKDQMQAVRWAVEDINAKGGVNGHPLEAVILDHQAKPEVGIAMVNRLVHVEKVPVFITAFSNVVKAVAPIANREKVLMLSVGANAPAIARLGDYVYTTFPLADVDMKALGKYAFQKMGKRRAAVLYVNHETGRDGAKVFRDNFVKAGGKIAVYESYEQERSDFTGLVLKVKSANPDIIHIHSVIRDFTAIVAQMRQLGVKTQITSYQTAFNPKMIEQLGKGAEGIIVTALAPSVEDNKNLPAYLERWKKAHNRTPIGLPYTQYFYDAPYIVAALYKWVLDRKLPITGENMRKALIAQKTFEQPLTNTVTINDDHTVKKPVYFWQVRGGRFTLIGSQKD